MQHMKTVVPATTREYVNFTTCDFCGTRIETTYGLTDEVDITYKTGERYPEGVQYQVDM